MVDIIVMKNKAIKIDFLYLDLNTCDRCMDTEHTLDEAVEELSRPLQSMGYDIVVNKVNIIDAELARTYHFKSSPTIRVDGFDILGEIEENACGACSDISGSSTSCRVFIHEGKIYNDPPKAMIIDGILKHLYSDDYKSDKSFDSDATYEIPENLVEFFKGSALGNNRCCGDEVKE